MGGREWEKANEMEHACIEKLNVKSNYAVTTPFEIEHAFFVM